MVIKLAYTNTLGYEYDIASGLGKVGDPIIEFTLDIATTGSRDGESGTPFLSKLLDGSRWELPVLRSDSQKIITLPNLLLAGASIPVRGIPTFFNYKELLLKWNFALSRWIITDELSGDISKPDKGYVKVVRGEEKLVFEQLNNISFAQRTTLMVITASVK